MELQHSMYHNRSTQQGFTLIELLIALTLVVLIVTLLFGGIRLGNKSWNLVDAKSERSSEMRLIWRFLHDRIGQSRDIFTTKEGIRKLAFYGDRKAFEFVSPMPAHLGISGLYMMRIHANRTSLKLTRWLYHPDIMDGAEGIPEWQPLVDSTADPGKGPEDMRAYYSQSLLIDKLVTFELDYYGLGEGESTPGWKDLWEEQQLPSLVRLRIQDDKGAWPEIIIGVAQ